MAKGKHLERRDKGYRMVATLMSAPGRDINITAAINSKLRYSQVEGEELRIKNAINEWFLDSRILRPDHLIIDLDTPYYGHDREMSMVFRLNINVTSRQDIPDGAAGFGLAFNKELDRLVEELGLLNI